MSGGYFDYIQYKIAEASETLQKYLDRCDCPEVDEEGNRLYLPDYSPETIAKFKECELTLRRAAAMLHSADWLISADDCESSFHSRWAEEVPDK
jgi:hypothetical protein